MSGALGRDWDGRVTEMSLEKAQGQVLRGTGRSLDFILIGFQQRF